ncbi:MAG: hypothetical protein JO290_03315 [Sphingomonadaceae bacterium]|nr:hypothetical protein [Sphingomonadaceae bacterium]
MLAAAPCGQPVASMSPARADLAERRYAVALMSRADIAVSADRIALGAKIVALVEADIRAMLVRAAGDSTDRRWRDLLRAIGEDLEDGAHRGMA